MKPLCYIIILLFNIEFKITYKYTNLEHIIKKAICNPTQKKGPPTGSPLKSHLAINYAWAIAPTGHAAAQVPQSVHMLGSIL